MVEKCLAFHFIVLKQVGMLPDRTTLELRRQIMTSYCKSFAPDLASEIRTVYITKPQNYSRSLTPRQSRLLFSDSKQLLLQHPSRIQILGQMPHHSASSRNHYGRGDEGRPKSVSPINRGPFAQNTRCSKFKEMAKSTLCMWNGAAYALFWESISCFLDL